MTEENQKGYQASLEGFMIIRLKNAICHTSALYISAIAVYIHCCLV